ncbi:MAG: CBS domain-containing protein [Candidatus Desulfaltia sp.]|nr:CBS domain-containing protein [Candidatus Desulfaltia sp.]
MFVSKSMTTKVITINKDADIFEAREKMAEHQIRHLPVITKDYQLIGIVSDRDIRSAMPLSDYNSKKTSAKIAKLKIKDIMTIDPITISPLHTIQDALVLMQKTRVGAFPVVDEKGKLRGIISVRDLLRAFINVMGMEDPGILMCIIVEEKLGQMKKIVDAITEEHISFGSIMVARYWDEEKRAVFPYLLTQNINPLKKKFKNMGYEVLDPMKWYIDQLPKND